MARKPPTAKPRGRRITPALLRSLPLPVPDADGDKENRGTALVVAGSEGMPGAAALSAIAALRAGAGKLQIATPKSVGPLVAQLVLEAYVLSLAENAEGAPSLAGLRKVKDALTKASAVLVGPGMREGAALERFVAGLFPLPAGCTCVIDAAALSRYRRGPKPPSKDASGPPPKVIITPHAGEMAMLLGVEKKVVLQDPETIARNFSRRYGIVTVLKGSRTFIADERGNLFYNDAGNVGLATSGSGDTLSGIITGLAARGAEPLRAAIWGVSLHARAGDVLEKRVGSVGFLARELLAEIPPLMRQLEKGRR